MSTANLKSLLAQGIEEDFSYLEFRAILIDFKEQGGNQKEALSILEELHASISDVNMQNRFLELMDLTEGLGIKTLRVW